MDGSSTQFTFVMLGARAAVAGGLLHIENK